CAIADSNLGTPRRRMGWARRPSFNPNKSLAVIRRLKQSRAVVAHIAWRHTKASFERTIEIGQITKARIICDRPDRILRQPRLGQHTESTATALRQQEFRKRRAFALKKALQITRRESEMGCYRADRQVAPVAVLHDV